MIAIVRFRAVRAGFIAISFLFGAVGSALTWPVLDHGSEIPQCAQALRLAGAIFDSNQSALFGPPIVPAKFPSDIALQPAELDISAGDDLKADKDAFDKLPFAPTSPRDIYWQKTPTSGFRFALTSTAMGWRGDMFDLFAVPQSATLEQLAKNFDQADAPFKPLTSGGWRPPLLLKENTGGAMWAIDVGAPYDFLASWHVYTLSNEGAREVCAVEFRPPAKAATALLPDAVAEWAKLLDSTLGAGANEGTLQPTAQIRIGESFVWANAAMRPWVAVHPFNVRGDVTAGLLEWSRKGGAYPKIYNAIWTVYPRAKAALAAYYGREFHRPKQSAQKLAAYWLDAAYRSDFVFPAKSGSNKPAPNPW